MFFLKYIVGGKMGNIYIVDAIMGSGKTSAAINKMNSEVETNFIFVTPFLDEVARIKKECSLYDRLFYEPLQRGRGKLDSLHNLLSEGKNIASTHALFQTYNDYTQDLIRQGKYVLILDEVCDVVERLEYTKDDIKDILNHGHLEGDFLIWDDKEYDGSYNDVKNMAMAQSVIVWKDRQVMWNLPIELFKAFEEVYIMTYLFEAQVQRYYYDYYGLSYEYIGVNKDALGNYQFVYSDFTYPDHVKSLKNKITIIEDTKLNRIGDGYFDLSVSWYSRELQPSKGLMLKQIKNNIYNVFANRWKSVGDKMLWTSFKNTYEKLQKAKYKAHYLVFNSRATNKYGDRTDLVYPVNIFLNPYYKEFFESRYVKIEEEKYALSEMVQWIWRSAIRNNESIRIYIPSKRMRTLLKNWLEEISK